MIWNTKENLRKVVAKKQLIILKKKGPSSFEGPFFVRVKGVEPPRLAALDPKPSLSCTKIGQINWIIIGYIFFGFLWIQVKPSKTNKCFTYIVPIFQYIYNSTFQ